jgi:hypothetical protein
LEYKPEYKKAADWQNNIRGIISPVNINTI